MFIDMFIGKIKVLILCIIPTLTIGAWWKYAPGYLTGLAQSLLERIGFRIEGIRAGSPAARFESRFKAYTGKGSVFRALQRWRREGIPEWLKMLILALGTIVLVVLNAMVLDMLVPRFVVKYV